MAMNVRAREALERAYGERGTALWEDPGGPQQLRGHLLEQCDNGCTAEINVLVAALEDQVPAKLLAADPRVPVGITLQKLIRQLQSERRLELDAAFWSAESWALALRFASPAEMSRLQAQMLAADTPPAEAPAEAQSPVSPDPQPAWAPVRSASRPGIAVAPRRAAQPPSPDTATPSPAPDPPPSTPPLSTEATDADPPQPRSPLLWLCAGMVLLGSAGSMLLKLGAPLSVAAAALGLFVWSRARKEYGVRWLTGAGVAVAVLHLAGAGPAARANEPNGRPVAPTDTAPPPSEAGPARPAEPEPPAGPPPHAAVAQAITAGLRPGYSLAGEPTEAGGTAEEGWSYRVRVRPPEPLYRVPVVPLRLSSSSPSVLRRNAAGLVVEPGLGPGRAYDADGAAPADPDGQGIPQTWRVRAQIRDGRWTVSEARREPDDDANAAGTTLLSAAELRAAVQRSQAALASYTARCEQVKREVADFRARQYASLPPRCAQVPSLLREVMDLASKCPSITDAGTRERCFARRDQLNHQMGGCERQNTDYDAQKTQADRAVAGYARQREAALRAELVQ